MTQQWYEAIMSDEGLPEGCVQCETSYDLRGIAIEALSMGRPIVNWNCQAAMMTEVPKASGFLTDILYLGRPMIPVFSPRLQQALSEAKVAGSDIEYLPIKVIQSTGTTKSGFAIANILTRVRALDRVASFMVCEEPEIDPATNQPSIAAIGKIAVFDAPLQGHDVVRLVEFPNAVLVSERFMEMFNSAGYTGAHFSRLKHRLT